MKKIVMFLFLIVFAVALAAPGTQAEESKAQYSALERMITPEGEMEVRVFVMPGMKRIEMKRGAQILRFDKGVMWVLMPSKRNSMYMEKSISAALGGTANLKYLEREKLGKETVNGISATKYKTVAQDPGGNRLEGFSWLTDDGILVKNDMRVSGGGRVMQIKSEIMELTVGKQDPSLFEVPEGFNKFAMPSGMGKGMPGGLPGGIKIPGR